MNTDAAIRHNMVATQVRTNKVTDTRIIAAMEAVARERFVPSSLEAVAYVDHDLEITPGRFLMSPMVFARLLQAAGIGGNDVVLDVGCGTGYSAAVISDIAGAVVALESDAGLADQASELLTEFQVDNVVVVSGDLSAGYPDQAPYDVIVLNGAVEALPEALTGQLANGGRLVGVILEGGISSASLYLMQGETLSRRVLFEAGAKLLPGFEAPPEFTF